MKIAEMIKEANEKQKALESNIQTAFALKHRIEAQTGQRMVLEYTPQGNVVVRTQESLQGVRQ